MNVDGGLKSGIVRNCSGNLPAAVLEILDYSSGPSWIIPVEVDGVCKPRVFCVLDLLGRAFLHTSSHQSENRDHQPGCK